MPNIKMQQPADYLLIGYKANDAAKIAFEIRGLKVKDLLRWLMCGSSCCLQSC